MPTKEDVLAAMARLDATIYGLKQGWSGSDVTRHIALDVATLRQHIEELWAKLPPPQPPADEPDPVVAVTEEDGDAG